MTVVVADWKATAEGSRSAEGGGTIDDTSRSRGGLRLHARTTPAHVDTRVRVEQARLFWVAARFVCALSLVVGAALVVAQWPVIDTDALIAWAVALAAGTLIWAALGQYFHHAPPNELTVERWHWLALGIATAQGVIWGAAGWLLFPPDNLAHQAILTVMLAGISAGAVSTLSPVALAGLLFLVPALLPLCYRLALAGEHDALLMLAIVLVLLLTLLLSNRHLYTTLRDNLRLRIEKAISEAALHESEARYRLMFDQSPLGIIHYDTDGRIVACNTTFIDILGATRADVLGSSMITEVSDERMAAAVRMSLETGWGYYEDNYNPVRGVNRVPLRIFFNGVTDVDDRLLGGVAIVEDFTQRKAAEEALNHQAFHDTLTGLPNRRLLGDRLGQALKSARRHQRVGALVFLDIDYFKRINDWLGHNEGDEVLKVISERLETAVRSEDTVARLSGDEFILLAPNIGHNEDSARRAIEVVTKRIQTLLQEPMAIGGRELRLSASMGITLFPRDEQTPEQLLQQSDTAMYVAKKEVRGEVRFHEQSMDRDEDDRLGLESELGFALEREELDLHYQPIVDADGRTTAGEALLRWQHPEQGWISPERFIPVAEASGLIVALGRWVIEHCCQWIVTLNAAERTRLERIAVNVSAHEFHHSEFARRLERTLDHYGLDGSWLTLEVTENVLIDRVDTTIRRMQRLKERGVRFEVDDFGTGYSSLTYLKQLPVDGIKIDRSFIRDVETDSNDAAIVDAILAMASRLGLEVIAEGVETADQLAFLREHGCRRFQGYLWSAPMDAAAFREYLVRN